MTDDDLREAARLHHAAMDNAEAGNLVSAFDHEVRAAMIYYATRLEPSRSILCRSAACLAMRIGRHAEAVALAEIGLAGSPPDCVRAELEDVREQATAIRKLENAMTDEQTLEQQFAALIIQHGPHSPVIHQFMHRHRDEGLFLRYALRLTQLQEYAADPKLLRNRRNHMNDTEQDLRDQLAERMRLYGPRSE